MERCWTSARPDRNNVGKWTSFHKVVSEARQQARCPKATLATGVYICLDMTR